MLLKTTSLSTKTYHSRKKEQLAEAVFTCSYLYWLYLKLAVLCKLAFIKANKYRKYWNFERCWLEELIDPYLKEVLYRLVSFLMELFNAPFSSCLLKNSGNKYFLFLSFFFFILNITASCKHNRQTSSNIVIIA